MLIRPVGVQRCHADPFCSARLKLMVLTTDSHGMLLPRSVSFHDMLRHASERVPANGLQCHVAP